jgi:hypothetical protein
MTAREGTKISIGRWGDSLPEVVSVSANEDGWSIVLGVTRVGERRDFEVPIDQVSFRHLRTVMQRRVPGSMPGIDHRYFFCPSMAMVDPPDWYDAQFFVVAGRDQTSFYSRIPGNLLRGLLWFCELKDFTTTGHHKLLRRVAVET